MKLADAYIGQGVVYRAPHVPDGEPGEQGEVTHLNGTYVFVRFKPLGRGVACPPERLTPMTPAASSD